MPGTKRTPPHNPNAQTSHTHSGVKIHVIHKNPIPVTRDSLTSINHIIITRGNSTLRANISHTMPHVTTAIHCRRVCSSRVKMIKTKAKRTMLEIARISVPPDKSLRLPPYSRRKFKTVTVPLDSVRPRSPGLLKAFFWR